VQATGESPGWIHRHRATLTPSFEIILRGGVIVTVVDGERIHSDNSREFILDLAHMRWRRVAEVKGAESVAP
jgi:hypothetical protein